jgi:hypothetical protein
MKWDMAAQTLLGIPSEWLGLVRVEISFLSPK